MATAGINPENLRRPRCDDLATRVATNWRTFLGLAVTATLLSFGSAAEAQDWRYEASLPSARWAPAATSLPDGTIYAIGGQDDQGFSTEVDIYQPSTRQWVRGPNLPDPGGLGMAAATSLDGRIFVFGVVGTSSVLSLTPGPNANWQPAAPMPTPRSFMGAATGKDGKIYVVGGSNASHNCSLNVLEIYNPATNQWTTGAPMPTPRCTMGVARGGDGRIYAIGGATSTGGGLNVVEAYSPAKDSWVRRAPLPTRRSNLSAAANGAGLIYAIGGGTSSGYVRTTNVYSPSRNVWWTEQPTQIAHVDAAAATGKNSRIFIIGGLKTGGGTSAAVESRPGFCDVCQ
jgi:N-acetylneuraminic acid mutarotase